MLEIRTEALPRSSHLSSPTTASARPSIYCSSPAVHDWLLLIDTPRHINCIFMGGSLAKSGAMSVLSMRCMRYVIRLARTEPQRFNHLMILHGISVQNLGCSDLVDWQKISAALSRHLM
ncbi:hypothetical protein U1Q18_043083 [Sarracenia purpurea var. burkii]